MRKMTKAIGAAALAAVAAAGSVEPAQARGHEGAAIAAGILGLGLGAAIASDHPHYHRVYYGPPRYYYGPPRGYYRWGYGPPAARVCRVHYDWYGYPHRRCWLEP